MPPPLSSSQWILVTQRTSTSLDCVSQRQTTTPWRSSWESRALPPTSTMLARSRSPSTSVCPFPRPPLPSRSASITRRLTSRSTLSPTTLRPQMRPVSRSAPRVWPAHSRAAALTKSRAPVWRPLFSAARRTASTSAATLAPLTRALRILTKSPARFPTLSPPTQRPSTRSCFQVLCTAAHGLELLPPLSLPSSLTARTLSIWRTAPQTATSRSSTRRITSVCSTRSNSSSMR